MKYFWSQTSHSLHLWVNFYGSHIIIERLTNLSSSIHPTWPYYLNLSIHFCNIFFCGYFFSSLFFTISVHILTTYDKLSIATALIVCLSGAMVTKVSHHYPRIWTNIPLCKLHTYSTFNFLLFIRNNVASLILSPCLIQYWTLVFSLPSLWSLLKTT